MSAGFALPATTPAVVPLGLAVLLLGVGFTLAHSLLQTRTTEMSPGFVRDGVSLFAALTSVGAALGTFAVGGLIDAFEFGPAFAAATVGLLVLAAYVPRLSRRPASSRTDRVPGGS